MAPNVIAVLDPPASTRILTLARAKEALGLCVDDASMDETVGDLIDAVSSWFTERIGRPISVQTVTEALHPLSRARLVLGLRPIVSVSEVRLEGVTLDPSEYAIDNAASGILWREGGWGGDRGRVPRGISQDIWIERGERVLEVDYRAGWAMPGGTPGAGETPLPPRLRQAALQLLGSWSENRDRSITSERSGDWSATYAAAEVPDQVAQAADAYADPAVGW